jgi:hypothetical protein
MKNSIIHCLTGVLSVFAAIGQAQDATIEIHAGQPLHRVSRYLTGACIEDVNHEVYGGIDSQMIFGESFAEPAPPPALKGFTVYGGRWLPSGDEIQAIGGDAPKLISDTPAFAEGEASVDVFFSEKTGGNAGLIVKVSEAGKGRDQFDGYEIALEPSGNLVLGRHRQNWEAIRKVLCDVPLNQWIKLTVRMTGKSLEVLVNGKSFVQYEDKEHPLSAGTVGLRTWQRDARFRNLSVSKGGKVKHLPFEFVTKDQWEDGVSGMWRAIRRGTATGSFSMESEHAFSGHQSQRITFTGGNGELGIENQSLNRWGIYFVEGKPYEGYLWVRAAKPVEAFAALESRDGSHVYAEKRLKVTGNNWQRLDFKLKPSATDNAGRFVIKLKQPGSIALGYALLQPGEWARFKGLPVRKDVAQGLIDQGITVLRLGGCMANAPEYRWKKMIGPREQRPPYRGFWYPHSSNGWGIFDFLNFCEAAGFLGIPDVNMDESPQDMTVFVEYVNGPSDSEWGRKRAADGHRASYHLKYLELGNEERVDENYWRKFQPMAEAIWARDPEIILVVGDFLYSELVKDPFDFTGNPSGLTSLAAQQKILQLAKQHNREVWFDLHVDTDGPKPTSSLNGMFSYIDALTSLADGAKFRVVVFELNAGNHSQRRALANALALNAIERDGRVPITTSANCLQPDGQNDNDWNQGLLFLNPSQVWLQPPGYVTRMISRNYQPLVVKCDVQSPGNNLDVSAKRGEDGKTLVLQVVNSSDQAMPATILVDGFVPSKLLASVEELTGSLHVANTAAATERIKPYLFEWCHEFKNGKAAYKFPPYSFTVIRLE